MKKLTGLLVFLALIMVIGAGVGFALGAFNDGENGYDCCDEYEHECPPCYYRYLAAQPDTSLDGDWVIYFITAGGRPVLHGGVGVSSGTQQGYDGWFAGFDFTIAYGIASDIFGDGDMVWTGFVRDGQFYLVATYGDRSSIRQFVWSEPLLAGEMATADPTLNHFVDFGGIMRWGMTMREIEGGEDA